MTRLSIPFTCTNMAATFLVIFIWYFSSSGLRLCLYTKGLYCLYTTKNTIVMSIYFETLQLSSNWKLVTNLKNEILLKIWIMNFFGYFLSTENKWRLHMCPLKNFDTRWYYNIHKLSQKNYLKYFGLQKTTTVDNYGGSPMEPIPFFSPTEHILGKLTSTESKLVKKEKITWWS